MVKKFLAVMMAVVVAGLALAIAYYHFFLPRQRPAADIVVPGTAAQIDRGRYLTINVLQCVDCHSERDWSLYGGPPVEPIGAGRACMDRNTPTAGVNVGQENFPGVLCIRNITPEVETGIGGWTDGELIRAIREGVDRNGEGLFPIMPYFVYRDLADDDVQAVVAYLRSMEPVRSERPPKRQIDFPLSSMVQLWPKPLNGSVARPPESDSVAYGEYLAKIARCEFCHTPRNPNSMAGFAGRRMAGGMPFFLNGKVLYSMNLTPHQTGLGTWSKEQFIARFKAYGKPTPVAPEENTLMNWNAFAGMTEQDLGALYDFFMTLPPVVTRLEPI